MSLSENTQKILEKTLSILQEIDIKHKDLFAVVGFDGFVDEIASVVNQRQNISEFSKMNSLIDFSSAVANAAGRSSLREIVIRNTACLDSIFNTLSVHFFFFYVRWRMCCSYVRWTF
jgi:hypothetical protein